MKKIGLLLAVIVSLPFAGCKRAEPKPTSLEAPAPEKPFVSQQTTNLDDAFWLKLNRRRVDKFRAQLRAAPPVLVVRESHYPFCTTNGMNMHYGWIDGKVADLGVSVSELVGYGYNESGRSNERERARTEFPPERGLNGYMTNTYDVIVTITNHPREAMQAEIRNLLKQQFGLAWHHEQRTADVLVLKVKDPQVLQSKMIPPAGTPPNPHTWGMDFARSKSISELASELENYFDMPVVDETAATNRYDKNMENVPSRWVNGRTTDLAANNEFLEQFGLELISDKRPQEWLVMDHVK